MSPPEFNTTLLEEVSTLNSIYPSCLESTNDPNTYVLHLPYSPYSELRLTFPTDYPECGDELPRIEGFTPRIVALAREVLEREFRGGEVLFDLIEGIRGELGDEAAGSDEEGRGHEGEGPGSDLDEEAWREEAFVPPAEEDQRGGGEPPDWALSEVVAEKKSVFVARAARVRSVEEVKRNLAHLVETDKKVARATHNILAYRITLPTGALIQDNDDDGEAAAGGRLGHLLSVMKVENVMVVVTRWYGGIKLGGDRFRLINSVAREAVVRLEEREGKGVKGGGK